MRLARLALLLVLATSLACSSDPEPSGPTATGDTGAVSEEDAAEALAALCELGSATSVEGARTDFYDRAHSALHAIAAAMSAEHPGSDADLLIAKQRVEAHLDAGVLPPGFADDVAALSAATAAGLDALGLPAPACA